MTERQKTLCRGLLVLPLGLAALVTYVLTVVGLAQIGLASARLISDHSREKEFLAQIFLGLDLLFVAPMAVMVIYALYLLAESVIEPERYNDAKRKLMDAKVFVLGLLATALAVHLVEGLLTGHIDRDEAVLCGGAIVLIGGYGLTLEVLTHRLVRDH